MPLIPMQTQRFLLPPPRPVIIQQNMLPIQSPDFLLLHWSP